MTQSTDPAPTSLTPKRAPHPARGLALTLTLTLTLTLAMGVAFSPRPAHAEDEVCPPPPEIDAALDVLLAEGQAAKTYMVARDALRDMWALWTAAPDTWSGELLAIAQERIAIADYQGALWGLDELVRYCPNWAEGWNQRAYVRFLKGDLEAALEDAERAVSLAPRHVAAISGKGIILRKMGREAEGDLYIREAVALHPWLPERGLLDPPAGAPR